MWSSFLNWITKNSSIIIKSLLVVSSVFSAATLWISGGTLISALALGVLIAANLALFFVNDSAGNPDLIEDELQNRVLTLENEVKIVKEHAHEINDKLTSYIHKNEEDKLSIHQELSDLKRNQRDPGLFSAGSTLFKKTPPQVTPENESNLENRIQGVRN